MLSLPLFDGFVQVGDEFIGIDSVSHCSLFDILEAGRDGRESATNLALA